MVVFLVLMTFVLFEYRRLPYTPHRLVVPLAADSDGAVLCKCPPCATGWLPDIICSTLAVALLL